MKCKDLNIYENDLDRGLSKIENYKFTDSSTSSSEY